MKIIITVSTSVVLCLLVTGCSQLQLTQDSELSSYDPFAGDAAAGETQSPQDPESFQPVAGSGRVRITDYREPIAGETDQARYPEVVDTDMTLIAAGSDNSKPPGITDHDPTYVTKNESRTTPAELADSTEDAEFVVDPFAADQTPVSDVFASAPMPANASQVKQSTAKVGQLAEPVLSTTMVETVATPVADEPSVVQTRKITSVDGFRRSPPVADNSDSIGWRAVR
jgi:hypothetical protein